MTDLVGRLLFPGSASKGGAEVAVALGRELAPEDTRSIVGWLSIGGVVRGTPFADRVLKPDLCWFARLKLALDGFDLDGAKSLQTEQARPTFESLRIPQRVPIVSYIAAPLSGHITSRGAFGYARMRSHGPNDGLTLLADEVIPGSQVLLAPGVDHFFQHEAQDLWTVALVRVLAGDGRSSAPRFGRPYTCWSTRIGLPSGSTTMKLAGPVEFSSASCASETPCVLSCR